MIALVDLSEETMGKQNRERKYYRVKNIEMYYLYMKVI
jgi:hypothetical protein